MVRTFLFGQLVATAIAVSACGRQVTPDPPNSGPGGLSPGFMSLKFDVVDRSISELSIHFCFQYEREWPDAPD